MSLLLLYFFNVCVCLMGSYQWTTMQVWRVGRCDGETVDFTRFLWWNERPFSYAYEYCEMQSVRRISRWLRNVILKITCMTRSSNHNREIKDHLTFQAIFFIPV